MYFTTGRFTWRLSRCIASTPLPTHIMLLHTTPDLSSPNHLQLTLQILPSHPSHTLPPSHPSHPSHTLPLVCVTRAAELAAVKVSPGDIALIAAEMEVEAKVAERRLREAGGDVRAALTSFL